MSRYVSRVRRSELISILLVVGLGLPSSARADHDAHPVLEAFRERVATRLGPAGSVVRRVSLDSTGDGDPDRVRWVLIDRAVRRLTPAAFHAISFPDHRRGLGRLLPITGTEESVIEAATSLCPDMGDCSILPSSEAACSVDPDTASPGLLRRCERANAALHSASTTEIMLGSEFVELPHDYTALAGHLIEAGVTRAQVAQLVATALRRAAQVARRQPDPALPSGGVTDLVDLRHLAASLSSVVERRRVLYGAPASGVGTATSSAIDEAAWRALITRCMPGLLAASCSVAASALRGVERISAVARPALEAVLRMLDSSACRTEPEYFDGPIAPSEPIVSRVAHVLRSAIETSLGSLRVFDAFAALLRLYAQPDPSVMFAEVIEALQAD